MTKLRFVAGVPAYASKIDAGHAMMWCLLGHAVASNEELFEFQGVHWVDTNPVGDARNQIVENALRMESDWVLMVDADTYYHGQGDSGGVDILQMIRDGDKADAAVIAAPVSARGQGWAGIRTVWTQDPPSERPGPRTMSPAKPEAYTGQVIPCERIGAAFMAINLRWLRQHMAEPPWFVHGPRMMGTRDERVHAYGEDVSFCIAARVREGLILCDGRVLPVHVMNPERR